MASRNKREESIGELVMTVIYAVLIALVIRTVAFEPFNIPSASMVPTLLVGDYVFVTKWAYGYSRYSLPFGLPLIPGRIFQSLPERGDVVVFKLPTDNSTDYIKRLIGLPGDRIQMKEGRLYINGQIVPREVEAKDYSFTDENGNFHKGIRYIETLPNGVKHPILEFSDNDRLDNTPEFLVPEDHVFMMGDDRDNSDDSRADVGYVPMVNLVGRANVRFFSADPNVPFWKVWEWVRWGRLFHSVDYVP